MIRPKKEGSAALGLAIILGLVVLVISLGDSAWQSHKDGIARASAQTAYAKMAREKASDAYFVGAMAGKHSREGLPGAYPSCQQLQTRIGRDPERAPFEAQVLHGVGYPVTVEPHFWTGCTDGEAGNVDVLKRSSAIYDGTEP